VGLADWVSRGQRRRRKRRGIVEKTKEFISMRKKLMCAMLALSMFMACVPAVDVNAAETKLYPVEKTMYDADWKSADLYVKNNSEDIIYVARELADCFDSSEGQWDCLTFGESYVVEKIGGDTQDEIYYYPLINGEDIVLVVSVYSTEDGWMYSLSEEMVPQLNYIDFENNQEEYTLYYDENRLIVESGNGKVEFPEIDAMIAGNNDFSLLETESNMWATYGRSSLGPLTRKSGYYPSLKIDEKAYKECKLQKPAGQGNDGMCWAAVCATMLNYEYGTSLTAKKICDYKGIDYNARANGEV